MGRAGSIGLGPVTVGYGPRRGGAGVTSRGTQQVVQWPSVEADGLRTRIRGHVLAFREDKGKLRGDRVKTSAEKPRLNYLFLVKDKVDSPEIWNKYFESAGM